MKDDGAPQIAATQLSESYRRSKILTVAFSKECTSKIAATQFSYFTLNIAPSHPFFTSRYLLTQPKAYIRYLTFLTLSIVGLWIISRGSEKMNVFSNQIPALSQSISQVKIQIMERLTL